MSIHREIEVTCPACKAKGAYTMWTSLNTQLDPGALHELAEGRLLAYHCKACGESSPVRYPVLVHAMRESEMVQLLGDNDPLPAMTTELPEAFTKQYALWAVRSQNDLMECARLYEAGLDRFAMLLLRLRLALDPVRTKEPVHKAVHFMGIEEEDGQERLLFVLLTAADEERRIFLDRSTWDEHVATLRDARERCVPRGVWTLWDSSTAMAAYDKLAPQPSKDPPRDN